MRNIDPGVSLLLPAWYDVLWTIGMLVFVVLPVALAVWLVLRAVRGPAEPAPSAAAAAARRHATAVSTLAWIALGLTLPAGLTFVAAQPLGLQQGLMYGLVPAVAGLVLGTVQAVGEATWPRPAGQVRRAPLVRRTVADVAPTRMRRLTWGWTGLLVVTLVVCGLAPGDGRDITRAFENGSSSAGPFPGWFYGLPLIAAALVLVLVAEVVLALIARRPAVSDTDPTWDLALRRLSAHRLLRGIQLVLGLTTSGVLLVAGSAVHSVGSGTWIDGVPMDSPVHVVAGIVVMLLGFASFALAVVATGLRADTPPAHAGTAPAPAAAPPAAPAPSTRTAAAPPAQP